MSSSEEDPRRRNPDVSEEKSASGAALERRPAGKPWMLPVAGLLLIVLLLAGGLFLWRSLGDTLSGTSTASDSLDSGPEPDITLRNGPGQIDIEGVTDLEAIEYEVTKHAVARDPASAQQRASEVQIDVSRDGSQFEIETNGTRNTGVDYTLRVPSGASIEVESEAGEIEATGLMGDFSALAEAGDVSVRNAGGSIEIEAPMGDVQIQDVNTETGQVILEVGAGDLDLTDLVIGTLEANVESGEATLSGRFSGGGRIIVHTGDINADLPPEDARDLSLEARIGTVERGGGEASEEPENEPDGDE